MCDKENENKDTETCSVCGCPIVDDDEIGRGCINGACYTNSKEVVDYADKDKQPTKKLLMQFF